MRFGLSNFSAGAGLGRGGRAADYRAVRFFEKAKAGLKV
jgi:hypothetical protein